MERFWNWLRHLFAKVCSHPNLKEQKWLDDEETPMVTCYCPDCGFWDISSVDIETWLDGE